MVFDSSYFLSSLGGDLIELNGLLTGFVSRKLLSVLWLNLDR